MSFNSLQFLIFLPIVLLAYWLTPHRFRYLILLAASYYFYMSWNAWLIFPILGTTLISYLCGLGLGKTESTKLRKTLLILAIVSCLGTLIFFKYFNFLIEGVVAFLNLFTLHISTPVFDILLPVGISFYTFQTLSYVIDVYNKNIAPERHIGYYALYIVYFPQLVAGPIERPENLLPQLREKHSFDIGDFSQGFVVALFGFFRKCVVADFCGIYVDSVFANLSSASSLCILIAGGLFAFQIYCDFAGYSEIAIGVAKMMGIKLSKNFDRPFLSKTYGEFWSRWHISLSSWFNDYVYMPLSYKSIGKKFPMLHYIIDITIVFVLSGLWHGPRLTYILWGLYAVIFVIIENLIKKPLNKYIRKHHINIDKWWINTLQVIKMFIILIPAAILFRASTLDDALIAFKQLFTSFGIGTAYFSTTFNVLNMNLIDGIYILLALITMTLGYYFVEDFKLAKQSKIEYVPKVVIVLLFIVVVAMGWLVLLSNEDVTAFSYFQF